MPRDLAPPAFIGHANHDFTVKPAGATQRLVQRIGAIGCGDDDNVRTRLQPVHQRQQLGDQPLFRLAWRAGAFGRDRIDLVDEDDRWRGLARFLEHLAQAALAFAIGAAHDFRAVDGEEAGIAFIGDRAGQPGLAGARRAMQQHALGRIDAKAGEQFRIAQRQFHHFAQLADGIAHAADIVIIDVAPAATGFLIFLAQLYLGIFIDMDDALGAGGNHAQANLGKGIGRGVEHPRHFGRHVAHLGLPGGGDQIARQQRTAKEIALQCLRRALQPHLALGRGKDHALRRTRFGLADLDMIARANLGIGALQPVEPDYLNPFILGIGQNRAGGGGALAGNLDRIAFGDAQRDHCRLGQPGNAMAAFFLPRRCNLQPHGLVINGCGCLGHESSQAFNRLNEARNSAARLQTALRRRRGESPGSRVKKRPGRCRPGHESFGRGCLKGRL